MSEQLTNSVYNPTAQLSAGIEAADLSLTVSDVSEFIDTAGDPLVGEFRVLLWDGSTDASKELVKVGAFDSGTGVCSSLTRAVEGKNPAMDHAAGDLVELVISAGGLEQYVSDHSGGGTDPTQWAFDADGNLTITSTNIPQTETGAAVVIDVSTLAPDSGEVALYANGCLRIDMTGHTQSALPITPSAVDGAGNVIFASMSEIPEAGPGNLPNIYLTDDHSPGLMRLAYGAQSNITSAFDPPVGQALFKLGLGDPAYTGDLLHCRDGNGALIFQVKSDGNVHIKTGAAVTADL